jgi:cytochrome c oxidase subunit 4
METAESSGAETHADAEHEGFAHVVPIPVLLAVFVSLMVLTVITVGVTYIDLGSLNLWIALGVATAKGSLVVLYFMHLRYDSPFNAIVFVSAIVFLFLFLGITLLDTIEYQPDIQGLMEDRL